MANLPIKYNGTLSWRTIARNVRQLTRELNDDAATYRIDIHPVDSNDIGSDTFSDPLFFTDYIGNPYRVIDYTTTTIDVSDDFKIGLCPTVGRNGYIHKSAYKGYSLYLPSHAWIHLHPLAQSNNNKFAMSILWQNDPNGRRIPFTNVLQPAIADYRGELTDEDGIVFKPMEDYGQNPQFNVFQILEDGTYSQIFLGENITRNGVDGLIDSVLFSGTGELITGYILIKN